VEDIMSEFGLLARYTALADEEDVGDDWRDF
jgi:hypothetical protein